MEGIAKPFFKAFLLLILLVILGAVLVLSVSLYVQAKTESYRFSNPALVPAKRVAVVFGAQVKRDGSLSDMLADRVNGAIGLYQSGKVEKILMTGDNGSFDYDEVSAMKRYAIKNDIPDKDITLDYAGFNTYESCYRAKEIFGLKEAVLVTQKYHLPRAVYACRKLGVEAVGLGMPDWEKYPQLKSTYSLREAFATVKALWQLHITHPKPTFLGKFEGVP